MEIEKQRGISVTSLRHAVPVRGLLHQHSGHPRPPGLLRGHLPHADGGGLAPSWSSTPPRASSRRPASSSRSAPCGTSRSSPSSTRWTGRPGTPLSCCEELEKELGIAHLPRQLAHRLRQGVPGRVRPAAAQRSSTSSPTRQRQGRHRPPRWSWTIRLWWSSSARSSATAAGRRGRAAGRRRLRSSTWTQVRHGKLCPVFFGSALTNFGVEPFLENFLQYDHRCPCPARAGRPA